MKRLILFYTTFILVHLGLANSDAVTDPTNCNPLKDKACFVKNNALNSDLNSMDLQRFNRIGNVTIHQSAGSGGNDINDIEWHMSLDKRFDNPQIESKFSILYGKVECDIKAASGQGIISSFYLQSNDLDEIDIAEIFGGNAYEYQSNFFIKGNTTTWDRGDYHSIPNPLETFNKYTVEWTPNEINWFVNNNLVRKLPKENQYGIPKSPMQIKFSLWAGGDPSNVKGTILWAGGLTNYDQFPYKMMIRNLHVNDYSTGKYYSYGHQDGQWVRLFSDNGTIGGRVGQHYEVEPEEFIFIEEEKESCDDESCDDDSGDEHSPMVPRSDSSNSSLTPTNGNSIDCLTHLLIYFFIELVVFTIWF